MPIYEYQCDACGNRLEIIQNINDSPPKECPQCQEGALRKLVSAAAFRLKGSGWYETDFKDKKARKQVASGDKEGAADKPAEKTDNETIAESGKETAKKPAGKPTENSGAATATNKPASSSDG